MLTELFNIEAEQIVLGTLLYDKDSVDSAYLIRPADFAVSEHRQIFEYMRADIDAGRSPTTTALIPLLAGAHIAGKPAPEYLMRLVRAVDRRALASCMSAVKAMAARRLLAATGDILVTQAREKAIDPGRLAMDAMHHLNEAMATVLVRRSEAEMVEPAAVKLVESLDGTDDESMVPTGLDGLDRLIGGFARGEMTIVAGRPSMGKSALLVSLARRAARKGVNILFFSLEMQKRAVVARMLSDAVYSLDRDLRIPYKDILRKEITPDQKRRLQGVLEAFKDYSVKIDDQHGLTMAEIQIRTQKFAEQLREGGKKLDLVIVDHIGKIKASDRYAGNVVHETAEKSDALMGMAKNMGVAVVAAHQLNRGPEMRDEKRPLMSDLRDTGNLEQDAHTIIFPYRAAYYLERMKCDDPDEELQRRVDLAEVMNKLEIIIAKSRNGETGNEVFFVDMGSNVVADFVAGPTNAHR